MTRAGHIIFADRVLIDNHFVSATIVITDGLIASVRPGPAAPGAIRLPQQAVLAPGFIDAQVNGGGGVLFNDAPTPEALRTIAAAHRAGGTTALLPTLITDHPGLIEQAAWAVRTARAEPGSGIAGLHLEGPFISPKRPGVHPPQWVRRLTRDDRAQLCSLPGDDLGALLITVAPEEMTDGDLRALSDAGAILAAGHTEATAARIDQARSAGLQGFTHLWNAMPPAAGRAPGPVSACLQDGQAWCSLIADGHHVDPVNLRLTLRCKPERVFLISDSMSPAGTELTEFNLLGRTIHRAGGRLVTDDGTLAGADLLMIDAVRNATTLAGAPLNTALRMASALPAAFLNLSDRGRIAPGYRADLVLLSGSLEILATCVEGAWTGDPLTPSP